VSVKPFSGGDRLNAYLAELAKKVSQGGTLKVGFMEGATEGDGESTPMIAAVNEFGGTIPARDVPAHVIDIYRQVMKDGSFGKGGKFVKRSKANFAQQVIVPDHTIPEHTIPPRPFFRRMIHVGRDHWGQDLGGMLTATGYNAPVALRKLGEQMVGELQQSIRDQVYKPLAKSTVSKKGFDTTLVDSGDMVNAVAAKVDD